MVLSADQTIEQLWDGKQYRTDSEIARETIESAVDDEASPVEQSHPFPFEAADCLEPLYKSDHRHLESEELFFFDKIDLIRQAILETISEMKNRRKLNQLFILGIDSKLVGLLHNLEELKHWSLGNNASIETRRIHLEKEVLQLEKEKRINNLNCWRDLLLLKKDLREALGEYKSLMRFKEIVS
jgi:hypothetical protein